MAEFKQAEGEYGRLADVDWFHICLKGKGIGMKNNLLVIAGACMAFSLAACGQKSEEETVQVPVNTEDLAETVRSIDGKFETPLTVKVGQDLGEQETYQESSYATDNAWIDLYKDYESIRYHVCSSGYGS